MKINLSPIASNKQTIIKVKNDTIIYNGASYDLTKEKGNKSPFVGNIIKNNDEFEITLEYFYDSSNCTELERYPNNPYIIENGELVL